MKSTEPSGDGYKRLLEHLDSDPVRAAAKFEELRYKLVRMLGRRDAKFPVTEDLADETLARVANNLAASKIIDNLDAHACKVAQYVWYEWLRENKRYVPMDGDNANDPPDKDDADDYTNWIERRHRCLDDCLADLLPESRYLIVEYYRFSGEQAVKRRILLAAEFGITRVALALRAHRIRQKLEECITKCEQKN